MSRNKTPRTVRLCGKGDDKDNGNDAKVGNGDNTLKTTPSTTRNLTTTATITATGNNDD